MDEAVVIAAGLVIAAILSTRFALRFGVPALVLFVGIGMFAGSSGPLGIDFADYALSLDLGLVALAIILFSGGIDTRLRLFRAALLPAGLLATVGTMLTALVVGTAVYLVTPLDLATSLLLGAVLSSTDAAAVFSALKGRGLPARLRGVLETESGTNDPMAIYLTIALAGAVTSGRVDVPELIGGVLLQLAIGAALGVVLGRLLSELINRVAIPSFGLYPVLALAGGLLAYGVSNLAGGNGFLTIYLVGLVLGNRPLSHRHGIATFMDGAAWGSQIVMFLVLGLLVFPDQLGPALPAALLVTVVLMFVARPVAVVATLAFTRLISRGRYHFTGPEQMLIAWAGLKGAVPIILAIVPLMERVPGGDFLFNVVFVVVIVGTLAQGWTIEPLARRLGLAVREPPAPPVTLELGGAAPIGAAVLDVYLEPESRAVGVSIRDLNVPEDVVIAAVLRDGRLVTPRGSTVFQAGDHVYLISSSSETVSVPASFRSPVRTAAAVPGPLDAEGASVVEGAADSSTEGSASRDEAGSPKGGAANVQRDGAEPTGKAEAGAASTEPEIEPESPASVDDVREAPRPPADG